MKKIVLIVVMFILTLNVHAQKFKFGKVSKEELQETQHPLYPEMDAAVLYRDYKTFYEYDQNTGFTLIKEVYERIKIYNTDGFKWGTFNIVNYDYNNDREAIENIKAYTYTLENGSVEKHKLSKDGKFKKRISKYRVKNTYTLPNLKEGCIVEISYKITSPFISIDDIDLQYTIPINIEKVKVKVPDFYVYNINNNPQAAISYTFEKDSKNIEITHRAKSGLGTQTQGSYGGTGSYKENSYTLDVKNVPPLKEESFVDNLDNYRAKSIWELSMYKNPGGMPKRYSTTWENVAKSIYDNDAFVNELNRTSYYAEDLAALLNGVSDPMEKMALIFNFVKQKVKWNNYVGYFPQEGLKKAYKEGTGSSGDINLMLTSMLRSANLRANPVLVSTKDNGIPLYPTRDGFNYLITSVEFGGKLYLLDATEPFANINLLPERAMNWQGRLIEEGGVSAPIGLYPPYLSANQVYVQAELDGTDMKCMVRERKSGHFAKNYRINYSNASDELHIDAINKNGESLVVTDFSAKELTNTKPHVTLSYKAVSESIVEEINDELYFSPMLFFAQKENPFKAEERHYPIFFGYPISKKYSISIKIPEGYTVSSLPENSKADLAGDLGSYTYLIKQMGNVLQLSVTLDIKTPIIVSTDYPYVKGIFSQIVEKENEKIVLKKVE